MATTGVYHVNGLLHGTLDFGVVPSPELWRLEQVFREDGHPQVRELVSLMDALVALVTSMAQVRMRVTVTLEEEPMAQLDMDTKAMIDTITPLETPALSAEALISGLQRLVQNAVDAALGLGATPEQLRPITDVTTRINQVTGGLVAAVVANTQQGTPEPTLAPTPAPTPEPEPTPAPEHAEEHAAEADNRAQ